MAPKPQRPERQDNVISSLNVAIEALNITKEILSITPAKAVCGSVSVILATVRDSMINEIDYVELGLACADICTALGRGMNGKKADDLNQSVRDATAQLVTTVTEIQRKVVKQSKRKAVSRLFHAKNDKETIVAWKSDLNRILHVFNTELSINTHVVVSDIHHDVVNTQTIVSDVHQGVINTHSVVSELHQNVASTRTIVADIHRAVVESLGEADSKYRSTQKSVLGESPPPPPRACFGRDEVIETIINLAENLTPIALVGPGGIGKTSIALTVLHHDRIKKRFGKNRRFIRCDQLTASRAHFLSRLSKVIGAGVENPEDLAPLRPFLSSKEMIIFLDNAESVLDAQVAGAQDIYGIAEELSQFSNICLCLTSRITALPTACEALDIPMLSMEAARNTFHSIYKNGDAQSDQFSNILEQLDFHPLSITLLATVAHHSRWDTGRLTSEWERRGTDVLRTQHNKSLAATIELSLASTKFRDLGPQARELLGVIAFFPQGVNEKHVDWLFPTLPDITHIFDGLCALSLTYRSSGFVTMLAPLRDYLRPKDPTSSRLLRATKDNYFSRLSDGVSPGQPGFDEAKWITSEDVNVEHLLDIFTSVDPDSFDVWDACSDFIEHLYWHKKRLTILGQKIEGLPDDHDSKPECLTDLARLFNSVGNRAEYKRLLLHTLKLWRDWEEDKKVAHTLMLLSGANRLLGLRKEGIRQAVEAADIYKQLGKVSGEAKARGELAWLLYADDQLDAAEQTVSQVIDILFDIGDQEYELCGCYRLFGNICRSKGETKKAIDHLELALGIATAFDLREHLFWIHHSMAELFFDKTKFDDAHTHIELSKSYAIDDPYRLGRATKKCARFWYEQRQFEEAKAEASRAADIYKKIGAMKDVRDCRTILREIEAAQKKQAASR